MATIKVEGYDKIFHDIQKLSGPQMDAVIKKGLYKGAGMMADAIAINLQYAQSPKATGQLAKSLGISKMRINKDGNWSTKIGFSGYDDKGVANALKARALNSGTSKQKKTQFLDKAVRQNRNRVVREIAGHINLEIYKITDLK